MFKENEENDFKIQKIMQHVKFSKYNGGDNQFYEPQNDYKRF